MTDSSRESVLVTVLLMIGFVMATIQFHTCRNRGIYHFDEAYYLLEAQAFKHGFYAAPRLIQKKTSVAVLKQAMRDKGDLFPPSTAKPTYSLLLFLFCLLPMPLLLAGNLLSLTASLGTACLLFQCLRQWNVARLPSMAVATLFFVSPTYDYYAVSGLAQCAAGFFFMAAILMLAHGYWRWLGFTLGLCVSCHYGMLPSVGLLLFFTSIHMWRRSTRPSASLASWVQMFLMFIAPLIFWQLLYWGVYQVFGSHFQDMNFRTYFQQLHYQVTANAAPHLNKDAVIRNILFFWVLARTEGIALCALLACAFSLEIFDARSYRNAAWVVSGTLSILIVFWLLNPGIVVSRIAVFILPLAYLTLGLASQKLASSAPRIKMIGGSLFFLLIAGSAIRSSQIQFKLRSVYPKAADYLANQNYQGPIVDLWNTLIWQIYVPEHRLMFQQGEVANFQEFEAKMSRLLQASQANGRLAFFVLNNRLPDHVRAGTASGQFFARLFKQKPAASWFVPYSSMNLYRYEEPTHLSEAPAAYETLNLYWISKRDLQPL